MLIDLAGALVRLYPYRGRYRLAKALVPQKDRAFRLNYKNKTFEGNLSEFIQWSIFCFGMYSEHEVRLFKFLARKVLPERPVFYDVGANIGNHSVHLSDVFDRIIAFEPGEEAGKLLARHLQINKASNIEWLKVALGSQTARLPLFNSEAASGNDIGSFTLIQDGDGQQAQAELISVERGDSLIECQGLPLPDLIKMDVEGFETQAIDGLQNTLHQKNPILFVEVWPKNIESVSLLIDNIYKDYGVFLVEQAFDRRNFRLSRTTFQAGANHGLRNFLVLPGRLLHALPKML